MKPKAAARRRQGVPARHTRTPAKRPPRGEGPKGIATNEAVPVFDDVVVCEVDFYQPIRFHGWLVFRQFKQHFALRDETRALERGCELALQQNVRCFIASVDGPLRGVNCAHYPLT